MTILSTDLQQLRAKALAELNKKKNPPTIPNDRQYHSRMPISYEFTKSPPPQTKKRSTLTVPVSTSNIKTEPTLVSLSSQQETSQPAAITPTSQGKSNMLNSWLDYHRNQNTSIQQTMPQTASNASAPQPNSSSLPAITSVKNLKQTRNQCKSSKKQARLAVTNSSVFQRNPDHPASQLYNPNFVQNYQENHPTVSNRVRNNLYTTNHVRFNKVKLRSKIATSLPNSNGTASQGMGYQSTQHSNHSHAPLTSADLDNEFNLSKLNEIDFEQLSFQTIEQLETHYTRRLIHVYGLKPCHFRKLPLSKEFYQRNLAYNFFEQRD